MTNELAPKEVEKLELAILGEGEWENAISDDPEEVTREIARRILTAESEGDIYKQDSTLSATDVLGVPLNIRTVRWQKSRMDGAANVFAIIGATRLNDGSDLLITCGGRNVMAQLLQAGRLGKIPSEMPVMFTEKETGTPGRSTLWLTAA
jgi:hypothetical protein